jgi:hypothetical protein
MPQYNPGPAFKPEMMFGTQPSGFYHPGQDFLAPIGTPIPAASDGIVVYSGFNGTAGVNGLMHPLILIPRSLLEKVSSWTRPRRISPAVA